MNRDQAEKIIMDMLIAIREVARTYNPNDDYLTLAIKDDFLSFNNSYFDYDNPEDGKLYAYMKLPYKGGGNDIL